MLNLKHITKLALVLSMVLLTDCARRKPNQNGIISIQNSQFGNETCDSILEASISILTPNSVIVRPGEPVSFEVSASGCTGQYLLINEDGSQKFGAGTPLVFNTSYNNAGTFTETVNILSITSNNIPMEVVDLVSDSFTIEPTLTCSAIPNASAIDVPVDLNGNLVEPVAFDFLVAPSELARVTQMTNSMGALDPTLSDTTFPTEYLAQHQISAAPLFIGTQTFTFVVESALEAGDFATCNVTVTTRPVTVPAPTIVNFTANPMAIDFGQSSDLVVTASGNYTSAIIANTAVNLDSNGQGGVSITPIQNGKLTLAASVTGPGGTSNRTVDLFTHPTCTIVAQSNEAAIVGNTFRFTANINGNYLQANLAGMAIAPVNINANAGNVNIALNPNVISAAQANSTVTLTVTGPDNTQGVCSTTFTVAEPSQLAMRINASPLADSAGVLEITQASNVDNCTINPGNLLPANTNPLVGFTKDIGALYYNQTYTLECDGIRANGTPGKVTAEATATATLSPNFDRHVNSPGVFWTEYSPNRFHGPYKFSNTLNYYNRQATTKRAGRKQMYYIFDGIPNGTYDAYASCPVAGFATNTPHYILTSRSAMAASRNERNRCGRCYSNAALNANVINRRINQSNPPVDLTEDGLNWTKIGTFNVTDNYAGAVITNGANNSVCAGAIRLKIKP